MSYSIGEKVLYSGTGEIGTITEVSEILDSYYDFVIDVNGFKYYVLSNEIESIPDLKGTPKFPSNPNSICDYITNSSEALKFLMNYVVELTTKIDENETYERSKKILDEAVQIYHGRNK